MSMTNNGVMSNDMMTACVVVVLLFTLWVTVSTYPTKSSLGNPEYVVSGLDNKQYYVVEPRSGGNSRVEAADRLSAINTFLLDLIAELKGRVVSKHYDNDSRWVSINIPVIYKNLNARYQGHKYIAEHRPKDLTETSYALNKQYIKFCLRNPEMQDQLHMPSILIFVAIHELTHLAIESHDHPDEFWKTFKFLLTVANDGNLYTPINYSEAPVKYCGLNIEYNPFYETIN